MLHSQFTKRQRKNFKVENSNFKFKVAKKNSTNLFVSNHWLLKHKRVNLTINQPITKHSRIEKYFLLKQNSSKNLISVLIKSLVVSKNSIDYKSKNVNYTNFSSTRVSERSINKNYKFKMGFFKRNKNDKEISSETNEDIYDTLNSLNANNSLNKQNFTESDKSHLKDKKYKSRTKNKKKFQQNAYFHNENIDEVDNFVSNNLDNDFVDNDIDNINRSNQQTNKRVKSDSDYNSITNSNSIPSDPFIDHDLVEIANYTVKNKHRFVESGLNTKKKRKKKKIKPKKDHVEQNNNKTQTTDASDVLDNSKTTVLNAYQQEQQKIEKLINSEDSDKKTGKIDKNRHATNQYLRKHYKINYWDAPNSILKVIFKDLSSVQLFRSLLILAILIAACTQIYVTYKSTQKTITYSRLLEQHQKMNEVNQNLQLEYLALTSRPNLAKVVLTNPWFIHINRDNEIIVVLPYNKDISFDFLHYKSTTTNDQSLHLKPSLLNYCNFNRQRSNTGSNNRCQ